MKNCACGVCNLSLENNRKLSKHIRDNHKKLSVKQYYDTYLKKELEGNCVICGGETRYAGLGVGYLHSCTKNCSAKLFRKNLKEDVERHNAFKQKVKFNMVKIWQDRGESGEKQTILNKAEEQKQKTLSEMSKEERVKKFGWLNKLTGKERQDKIDEMMLPLVKYWENITDEQVMYLYHRRLITMVENSKNNKVPEHLLELTEDTKRKLDEFFGVS